MLLYISRSSNNNAKNNMYVCMYVCLFFSPWMFFTSTLAYSLSQEFEWQQVSSSLQDFCQYSSQFQLCSSSEGLHSTSYFHILLSFYQSFGSKRPNYNWYNCHFHVPQFFQFPSKVQVLILQLFTPSIFWPVSIM